MCLSLVAGCCEDTVVVDKVLPFVLEYITDQNWKLKDSAVMALGVGGGGGGGGGWECVSLGAEKMLKCLT